MYTCTTSLLIKFYKHTNSLNVVIVMIKVVVMVRINPHFTYNYDYTAL